MFEENTNNKIEIPKVTLITNTAEEGRALAIELAKHTILTIHSDKEI